MDMDLNLAEQLSRIAQLQVDTNLKQQQVRFAPWQLLATGLLAGGGLVGALAAAAKIF